MLMKHRSVYDLFDLRIERSKSLNRLISERCVCTNASSTSCESVLTNLMLTIASKLGASIINAQRIWIAEMTAVDAGVAKP